MCIFISLNQSIFVFLQNNKTDDKYADNWKETSGIERTIFPKKIPTFAAEIKIIYNMTITLHQIFNSFLLYNIDYFDGTLPTPNFKIHHGWNTLGYFRYCPEDPFGTTEIIEISDFYDYTEEQFRDVLIHEMIHYYLCYTGEDPRCRHGKAFKRMAKYFNEAYGMNIAPTIDLSIMKPAAKASKVSKFFFKIFN